MTLLEKFVSIFALAIIIFVCYTSLVHADDCNNQCSERYANTDAKLICVQICNLNDTNVAILEQLKRIADANQSLVKGN